MSAIEQLKKVIPPVLPETTALIIIDMQNDFVKPEGYVGSKGHDLASVIDTIPENLKLLRFCREKKITVIFTQTVHHTYTDSKNWLGRSGEKKNDAGICRPRTWGSEIIDELKPLNGEIVVEKHRYDAMLDTDLDLILRSKNIATVLITGTQTNLCVDSTARHIFMMDYKTILVRDCISTTDADLHEPMLRNFHLNFGYVVSLEKIIEILSTAEK